MTLSQGNGTRANEVTGDKNQSLHNAIHISCLTIELYT